jgi:1,4-dihydroxy-6-naphthoate synthase
MQISIGFSPCPNDTYIFEALVSGAMDTGGLRFDVHLEDVETLNRWALEKKLQVTKFSYGVLDSIKSDYRVLNTGSALGAGVGPLLVGHPDLISIPPEQQTIALPGMHTTAHLLFKSVFPKATKKLFLRYDAIEGFALEKKGLGVIIHENRFTYTEKGLVKFADLGEHWEQNTGMPVPLGGIAVRRDLDRDIVRQLERMIGESIRQARTRTEVITPYIARHAQEMGEAVMRQHIELYVNDYSLDLGEKGRSAILGLMQKNDEDHIGNNDLFYRG